MPTQRFWVFRLYDSANTCLYVGKTIHHPSRIVRTYRHQRDWGDLIDPTRTVMEQRATEVTALNAVSRWTTRYKPVHRTTVPTVKPDPDNPTPPKRKYVPPEKMTLLERAALAQARHRELTK